MEKVKSTYKFSSTIVRAGESHDISVFLEVFYDRKEFAVKMDGGAAWREDKLKGEFRFYGDSEKVFRDLKTSELITEAIEFAKKELGDGL